MQNWEGSQAQKRGHPANASPREARNALGDWLCPAKTKMCGAAATTTDALGARLAAADAKPFESRRQLMSEARQQRHRAGPRLFFPLTLVFFPSATSTHSSRRYSRTLSTVGSASVPFLPHQARHAASLPSTRRRVSALARCPTTRACRASNAAAVAGLRGGGCAPALGAAIPTPSASLPPLSTSMPPRTGSSRSSRCAGSLLGLQIGARGSLFACTAPAGLVGSCWSASRRGRRLVSLAMRCAGRALRSGPRLEQDDSILGIGERGRLTGRPGNAGIGRGGAGIRHGVPRFHRITR